MKKKILISVVSIIMTMGMVAGCGTASPTEESKDVMYQGATLQSLMLGYYYGFVSVGDIKENGDIGLGTFDAVDGEMIVVDGNVYQAKGDGSISECDDSITSPFCSVTWFDEDLNVDLVDIKNLDMLKVKLDECINDYNPNMMYVLKMPGTFQSVTVRSELAQKEPYKDLATALKTDQVVFPELKNTKGTVVAVYFPSYMDGVNTPGWHFHYISDDHKSGGHVMDLAFSKGAAKIDATSGFKMVLPDDEKFAKLGLNTNLDKKIQKVEGGK